MHNRKLEAILYSGAGVLVMFVVIVAVNAIGTAAKVRMDITEDNIYTLSEGTEKILRKLDTPVEIRFYATRNESYMPVEYRNYARRIEDILHEFKSVAGDNLEIKKYDPQPDSDAEDLANLDGIEGHGVGPLGMEKIYLGVAVSMLDAKATVPFLDPSREKLLEYDLARAISQVINPEKGTIGVISSLPVFGTPSNPMMAQMGQQGQDPWLIITELQRDFDVRDLGASVDQIDDDVNLLLVIHPKNLSEATEYAIDQFILRGGKMIALLDPKALTDRPMPGNNPLQSQMQPGSNLEKLLPAWGLSFDPSKVVADTSYMAKVGSRSGQPQDHPGVLALTEDALNPDDIVTSQIDNVTLVLAGAFTGEPVEGLTKEVMLHSSDNAQLVEGFMAQMGPEQILKDFKSDDKEYALALRLTGTFKTAFPDGKPKSDEDDKDEANADSSETAQAPSLKESEKPGMVVLVGDTDFIYDEFAAQVGSVFGQRVVMPRGGNLTFMQSLVEQLSGDSDLIAVRSRATMKRPFTRIREMQSKAQEEYQDKLSSLEEDLQETQRRINELQSFNKNQGQQFVLSPEQQKELERFRHKKAEVNQELKEVRRNLRKDIDALKTRLKWINIALMPLLVAISGVTLAIIKRKRTAAK